MDFKAQPYYLKHLSIEEEGVKFPYKVISIHKIRLKTNYQKNKKSAGAKLGLTLILA